MWYPVREVLGYMLQPRGLGYKLEHKRQNNTRRHSTTSLRVAFNNRICLARSFWYRSRVQHEGTVPCNDEMRWDPGVGTPWYRFVCKVFKTIWTTSSRPTDGNFSSGQALHSRRWWCSDYRRNQARQHMQAEKRIREGYLCLFHRV